MPFVGGSDGKASVYNVRAGFNPWVGKIPWRRKWQPTPVLLTLKIPWTEELGAGYYPWGCKESGTTERLHSLSHSLHTDNLCIYMKDRKDVYIET